MSACDCTPATPLQVLKRTQVHSPNASMQACMHDHQRTRCPCIIAGHPLTALPGPQADKFPLHPRLVHAALHWAQALLACGALQAPNAAALLEERLGVALQQRLGPWKHSGGDGLQLPSFGFFVRSFAAAAEDDAPASSRVWGLCCCTVATSSRCAHALVEEPRSPCRCCTAWQVCRIPSVWTCTAAGTLAGSKAA